MNYLLKYISKHIPLYRKQQIFYDIILPVRLFINIILLKMKYQKLKIYTYKKLVKTIKNRNDVCHVIASGFSAVDSYKRNIIKENDFIIGMNFSAFLPYHFDLYFCEDHSREGDLAIESTKKQLLLINKRKNNISNLIFKNIYESNHNCFWGEQLYKEKIDYSVILDKLVFYKIVEQLLEKPGIMMPQYASTVIAATMIAYHAGFKNIVIHGLDFEGPHLYHDRDLQEQTGMDAPTPYVSNEIKHGTASVQELIWPELIKAFSIKGINLYCASQDSKFKKYANIYKNEMLIK